MISIVCVFLIILAGSVVRMTGSGMGCPDWPKCFGHTIPPSSEDQVIWKPNTEFFKGQIIVHNESLWVAQKALTSTDSFDAELWEPYTKHDYAIFNVFHTWVEFINRLIGAFSGIPILLLLVSSIIFWRKEKRFLPVALSLGALFMMGFEAWLGKLVVDGNLIPGSITIHMVGAVVIVFLLVAIQRALNPKQLNLQHNLATPLLIFTLICFAQLVLGTQVREEVDYLIKDGTLPRIEWIENIPVWFVIHRSFSWVVLLFGGYLIYKDYKQGNQLKLGWFIGGMIILQIAIGVGMAWFAIPKFLQPSHLVGSVMLLAFAFDRYLIAIANKKK
ncbi:MAG: COX15/CtaA family protein [Flavobacteriales bacterium]|nr:COX15/CtaA family protein [Flavobacteriales bacterium]